MSMKYRVLIHYYRILLKATGLMQTKLINNREKFRKETLRLTYEMCTVSS